MKQYKLYRRLGCVILCVILAAGIYGCSGAQNVTPTVKPTTPMATLGNGTSAEDVLNTKQQLFFDEKGEFDVIIFSDLRVSKTVGKDVIANMEKVLDQASPDLVIFGGDLHDGSVNRAEELQNVLDAISAPLTKRNIPWCHTFGLDTEGGEKQKNGFDRMAQMQVYQSYPGCLSVSGPDTAYGVSNYVLPIRIKDNDNNSSNDKVGFNVWCLDANGYLNDYESGLEEKVLLKRKIGGKTNFDCIHYSQLLWYWDTSVAMQEYNGGKQIPGMMYFQIPPMQLNVILRNQDQTDFVGNKNSKAIKISASERESGVFWACYERGDIRGIFCGYNEENDFCGSYLDVIMGFCSTVGKSDFKDTMGARLVSISKNGQEMKTSMVYVK